MIKLALSLAEPYRLISQHDTALDLPPEPTAPMPRQAADESDEAFAVRAKAWAEPIRAWGKPLRTARETGDYSALLKPGETPTIFVIRQISASEWLRLDAALGRVRAKADDAEDAARASGYLLVRYAVLRLENAPPAATLPLAVDPDHPELGPIQPVAFVDLFTGNDRILMEIAAVVGERRHTPPN